MTASATKIDWTSLSGIVLEGGYELKEVLDAREGAAKLRVRILGSGGRTATAYFQHLPAAEAEDQQDIWQTLRDAPHPNLNRPAAAGRRDVGGFDTVYMILPDADEKLTAVVPERALEWEEAAEVLHSCEKGLAHLHAHGLIHGSLSPQTVEAVGYTVILNTESVRRLGKKLRVEWSKPQYLAPESKGANLTTAADVWCLGASLIEVLSQHPYGSPGGELDKGLPLAAVIQRCIDKNPVTRCTLKEAPAFEAAEPEATVVGTPPAPKAEAAPVVTPVSEAKVLQPPGFRVEDYEAIPVGPPPSPATARSGASRIPQPLTPKAAPKPITKEEMALVPVGKRHKRVQKRQPIDARIRTLDERSQSETAEEERTFFMPAVDARILAVGNRSNLVRNVIAAAALAALFFAAIHFIIIPKLQSTEAPMTSRISAQTPVDVPTANAPTGTDSGSAPIPNVAATPRNGTADPLTPSMTPPLPTPDPVMATRPQYFPGGDCFLRQPPGCRPRLSICLPGSSRADPQAGVV